MELVSEPFFAELTEQANGSISQCRAVRRASSSRLQIQEKKKEKKESKYSRSRGVADVLVGGTLMGICLLE